MISSRSETEFATRVNRKAIERIEEVNLVGVWLDWKKNTKEVKYAGVGLEDLLHIYLLYVWNSTLTVEQSQNIENIQKLCFKVILGAEYKGYEEGGIDTLL